MKGRVIPFKQAKDGEALAKQQDLRTGCSVPESGIYRVLHSQHKVPQEVTLIRNHFFPRCSRCSSPIYFELVRPAPAVSNRTEFSVTLYELPVLGEQEDESLAI
jgi:hypothetical protein